MTAKLTARALRLLATREHSQVELRRKLAARAEEGDDIEAVIGRLSETGLQSDERFAESYVRSRAERVGAGRLKRELSDRGVSAEIVESALAHTLEEDEPTRARAVWRKKFGNAPQDAKEWARQARFLQARGFSADIIRKLLKEPFDESA
ncbi:MAG: recombination regulator RecX [Rhodocyclaceae bacterium]